MSQQTVLITGASVRLGRYLAQQLHAGGYRVITACRTDPAKLDALARTGIEIIQADLSTVQGIDTCIGEVLKRCTSLRALIHNASLWHSDEEASGSMEVLDAMMRLHIAAPYRMNRELRQLLERDGIGDIIHITDYLAHAHAHKHIAYAATKAALEHMTRSFAAEFGPGIKVNSIAPGIISFRDSDSAHFRKRMMAPAVFKDPPGPQALWDAVSYLMRSDSVTGTCLHVDSGRGLSRGQGAQN